MSTKEEILKEHAGSQLYPNGDYDGYSLDIYNAMEEYAKEVAIDFLNWVDANHNENHLLDSKQLLELYLKTK